MNTQKVTRDFEVQKHRSLAARFFVFFLNQETTKANWANLNILRGGKTQLRHLWSFCSLSSAVHSRKQICSLEQKMLDKLV